MKWIDYVTKALENLGGRSPLSMIYEEVDLLRSKDSLDAKHLKEQVRESLKPIQVHLKRIIQMMRTYLQTLIKVKVFGN